MQDVMQDAVQDAVQDVVLLVLLPVALIITSFISCYSLLKWITIFIEIKKKYAHRIYKFNYLNFLMYNPITILTCSNIFIWITYDYNRTLFPITILLLGILNILVFIKFYRQSDDEVINDYVVLSDFSGWSDIRNNNTCDGLDDDIIDCLINGNIQKYSKSDDTDTATKRIGNNGGSNSNGSSTEARKAEARRRIKSMHDEFIQLRINKQPGLATRKHEQ